MRASGKDKCAICLYRALVQTVLPLVIGIGAVTAIFTAIDERSLRVEVRRLKLQDCHLGVVAIRELKAPDGYPVPSTDYLPRFLSKADNVLIVAFDGDIPIGYTVAYLLDRVDRDQQMMFFYEIGVAESHRRRGVGKRMIAALKAICRAQNVMKMWVPNGRSNTAATCLYASTGAAPLPAGDEVTYAYPRASFMGDAGDQRA